jgi:hypothetical protein
MQAYFATPETGNPGEAKTLNLVVPLTKEWRDLHDAAWRRLMKNDFFKVTIYEVITTEGEEEQPAQWYVLVCQLKKFLFVANKYIGLVISSSTLKASVL